MKDWTIGLSTCECAYNINQTLSYYGLYARFWYEILILIREEMRFFHYLWGIKAQTRLESMFSECSSAMRLPINLLGGFHHH